MKLENINDNLEITNTAQHMLLGAIIALLICITNRKWSIF